MHGGSSYATLRRELPRSAQTKARCYVAIQVAVAFAFAGFLLAQNVSATVGP